MNHRNYIPMEVDLTEVQRAEIQRRREEERTEALARAKAHAAEHPLSVEERAKLPVIDLMAFTAPAVPSINPQQAYDKGRRSQQTQSDWDVAQARFSNKYCSHNPLSWCELETTWADGWDDSQENHKRRRPPKDRFLTDDEREKRGPNAEVPR